MKTETFTHRGYMFDLRTALIDERFTVTVSVHHPKDGVIFYGMMPGFDNEGAAFAVAYMVVEKFRKQEKFLRNLRTIGTTEATQ